MGTRSSRTFTYRSRERIQAAKLETHLIKFVNGEHEMSRTQVYAAVKLLDKVMPNLRAIGVKTTESESKSPRDMTDEELLVSLYRSPGGKEEISEVLLNRRQEIMG